MRTFEITADGFDASVSYEDEEVARLEGLIRRWWDMASVPGNVHRTIALLAAPPGAGKTTLVRVIEQLAAEQLGEGRLQAVSMDGFHYHNSYLATHKAQVMGEERLLADVKGAPESFDLPALAAKLAELRDAPTDVAVFWPAYDRTIHDPRPDAILLAAPIVLVEGNWLLLDEPGWRDLANFADDTMFLKVDEGVLRERLIGRKVRGGLSREQAEAWYDAVDGPNIRRCLC